MEDRNSATSSNLTLTLSVSVSVRFERDELILGV